MPQLGSPLLGGFFNPIGTELRDLHRARCDDRRARGLRASPGHGYWSCTLKFYGPAKASRRTGSSAKRSSRAIPGATFEDGERFRFPLSARGDRGRSRAIRRSARAARRCPSSASRASRCSRSARAPRRIRTRREGHMWFSPIIPRTRRGDLRGESRVRGGRARARSADQCRRLQPADDVLESRVHLSVRLTRHARTSRRTARIARSSSSSCRSCAEHGWGEYRTPPAYQEAVMSTYSFNDHALRRFHETLKDAVDPNGILVGRPLRDLAEASAQGMREMSRERSVKHHVGASAAVLAVVASRDAPLPRRRSPR